MEKHICGKAGTKETPIISKTYFGHGDSTHETYVECLICGKKSNSFSDWSFPSNKTIRLAQDDWDNITNIK